MHWISPADEKTHEDYLHVLAEGGFDDVLDGIGKSLGLDGLVAYHLTFIGVSTSERGFSHHDTTGTDGGVYNIIIPLLLEDGVPPELILWDDEDDERGGYKYQLGVGAMMGDDAVHGTYECDYRNLTNARHGGLDENTGKRVGMRLAATVYIAEVYDDNLHNVAKTLTQIFPIKDEDWMIAQEARHWQAEESEYIVGNKMVGDVGRKAFRVDDELDSCEDRAEKGMCESDVEGTRKKCLFSCKIYIEEGPTSIEKVDDNRVNVCVQNRTGGEECRIYEDDTNIAGAFITPNLQPGEMFPIVWRTDTKRTTDYAFQIGLPPELTPTLLEYCNELGVMEAMAELTGDDPLNIDPEGGSSHDFYELGDGHVWYVQRPPQKWQSNMHWISPADEETHEEYLLALAAGNFDLVLDAIGKYLGLEGLVAYHLTFIGVSYSEKGFMHRDTHHTGASVYNVIIPLILEEDATPELVMTDTDDENRAGALKYKIGTGAMMGDDAMHGTEACDYREKKGMRLAATVYIADINDLNAKKIAKQTLTQIFPLPDAKWLKAQAGRHWRSDGRSLENDGRRRHFSFRDQLSDCAERAAEGKCIHDAHQTRLKCLKSCEIYELNGDEEENDSPEFDFGFEEYVPGKYIDAFFSGLDEDDSCFDESDECPRLAKIGLCMTDKEEMEEEGCHKSCLYCITPASKDLFSLGVDQVTERNVDEKENHDNEPEDAKKVPPSPSDIAEVVARTEFYFVNHVLLYDDLSSYRLSCRNFDENCAYWAAVGNCESDPGYMGKHCPAACSDCEKVDVSVRCPIDKESDIFQPGDMNDMFERWLEEAGQDTLSLSKENLPTGGTHPFGALNVITSPYHDMMQYIKDDELEEDPETFPPLPWVVSIDGFLSDEECDKLIELGVARGYERSTEYSDETNVDGSAKFIEATSRTSTNTFCEEGCDDDPTVKRVLQRMAEMTGIPSDNYESLQLVRYEKSQFYKQHHDLSIIHNEHPYGPRILTFFLYLNDKTTGLESGGGTKFDDLGYTAEPKKGMALVWPSVRNDLRGIEDWTWHEALPVNEGIKYGANTWMHLRDFQHNPDYC
ncbi:hypothetical protein ACHAXR_012506 [Thalassiosira sp. AJA248-18]